MPHDTSQFVNWLYLDMNSFFASVEQEMNPLLRGKPVAVVPLQADTTCCIAVSYEGKAFGIKTGTKVRDARRLCPKIEFVVGKHENYVRYHNRIIDTVESCLHVESVCSIDEIACRLTGSHQNVDAAEKLCSRIKAAIRNDVGSCLRCSIGVAPNRYLAKIAADMKKPDGFTAMRPCDLPGCLLKLSLRDLPGIGAKTEERLNRCGIYDMKTLLSLSANEMTKAFGSVHGEQMWHLLRGTDAAETQAEQKSVSHSQVLPPELRNEAGALTVLKTLTVKTATRLRKDELWASSIQIFVRFIGRDSWNARSSLDETQDTMFFIHAVKELWRKAPKGSILQVGVALTGLVTESQHAPTLFDDPKRERLVKAVDHLNNKFGKDMIHFGATHNTGELLLYGLHLQEFQMKQRLHE